MRLFIAILITAALGFQEVSSEPISHQTMLNATLYPDGALNKGRVKKKKIKRVIRKAGRVYRTVKPGAEHKKKSRQLQRKAKRIVRIL